MLGLSSITPAFPLIAGRRPRRSRSEWFSVTIVDGSGQVVAAHCPSWTYQKKGETSAYSLPLSDSFPYRPDPRVVRAAKAVPGARAFLLTLATVIAALFFGGFTTSGTDRNSGWQLKSDFTATVSRVRTPLSHRCMAELLQGPRPTQARRQSNAGRSRGKRAVEPSCREPPRFSKIERDEGHRMEETDIAAWRRTWRSLGNRPWRILPETAIADNAAYRVDKDALGQAILNPSTTP
jgi:hypothetical protein